MPLRLIPSSSSVESPCPNTESVLDPSYVLGLPSSNTRALLMAWLGIAGQVTWSTPALSCFNKDSMCEFLEKWAILSLPYDMDSYTVESATMRVSPVSVSFLTFDLSRENSLNESADPASPITLETEYMLSNPKNPGSAAILNGLNSYLSSLGPYNGFQNLSVKGNRLKQTFHLREWCSSVPLEEDLELISREVDERFPGRRGNSLFFINRTFWVPSLGARNARQVASFQHSIVLREGGGLRSTLDLAHFFQIPVTQVNFSIQKALAVHSSCRAAS